MSNMAKLKMLQAWFMDVTVECKLPSTPAAPAQTEFTIYTLRVMVKFWSQN
jgi:hypothetical protein